MRRNSLIFLVGITAMIMMANIGLAKDNVKTIGVSSAQALTGVKEHFEIIDDQTTDGFPLQYATTEHGFISVELNGMPDDLTSVSIDLILSDNPTEQRDIDNKKIVSRILQNIFAKAPEILDWYNQYLGEGLKQKDRIEQQTETKDKKQYVRLVIVESNGHIVGIEITPEPKKSKSKK